MQYPIQPRARMMSTDSGRRLAGGGLVAQTTQGRPASLYDRPSANYAWAGRERMPPVANAPQRPPLPASGRVEGGGVWQGGDQARTRAASQARQEGFGSGQGTWRQQNRPDPLMKPGLTERRPPVLRDPPPRYEGGPGRTTWSSAPPSSDATPTAFDAVPLEQPAWVVPAGSSSYDYGPPLRSGGSQSTQRSGGPPSRSPPLGGAADPLQRFADQYGLAKVAANAAQTRQEGRGTAQLYGPEERTQTAPEAPEAQSMGSTVAQNAIDPDDQTPDEKARIELNDSIGEAATDTYYGLAKKYGISLADIRDLVNRGYRFDEDGDIYNVFGPGGYYETGNKEDPGFYLDANGLMKWNWEDEGSLGEPGSVEALLGRDRTAPTGVGPETGYTNDDDGDWTKEEQEQFLKDIADTDPTAGMLEEGKIDDLVQAQRQRTAFESSRAMRAAMQASAQAGAAPEYQAGITAEMGQRSGIAQAEGEAKQRLQLAVQNAQAALTHQQQRVAGLMQVAAFAQNKEMAKIAAAAAKEARQQAAEIQRQLMYYQAELNEPSFGELLAGFGGKVAGLGLGAFAGGLGEGFAAKWLTG